MAKGWGRVLWTRRWLAQLELAAVLSLLYDEMVFHNKHVMALAYFQSYISVGDTLDGFCKNRKT